MPLRTLLTGLLLESESSVVVECRRCGTNVSRRTEQCPNCEGAAFSRYEFPG